MSLSPVEIHIMRTAAELWELAGPDMWLYRWSDGLALLQGKTAGCAMTAEEYAKYQRMRGKWQDAGQDLDGAPMVSMRQATAHEDVDLDLRVKPSRLACAFREVEQLLIAHQACIEESECEEIFRQIGGKMLSLKEAVLRAEEIWREEHPAAETLSTETADDDELEALDAWHKAEAETCVEDLLRGVPLDGCNASRNDLRNLILSAFLSGAVEQLTRPFVRKGGPEAA